MFHVLIVEWHNLAKTLQGRHTNLSVQWLSCLTYHLHYEMSLILQPYSIQYVMTITNSNFPRFKKSPSTYKILFVGLSFHLFAYHSERVIRLYPSFQASYRLQNAPGIVLVTKFWKRKQKLILIVAHGINSHILPSWMLDRQAQTLAS